MNIEIEYVIEWNTNMESECAIWMWNMNMKYEEYSPYNGIIISNTNMDDEYEIRIWNIMESEYLIWIWNKNMKYEYEIRKWNKNMEWEYEIRICKSLE